MRLLWFHMCGKSSRIERIAGTSKNLVGPAGAARHPRHWSRAASACFNQTVSWSDDFCYTLYNCCCYIMVMMMIVMIMSTSQWGTLAASWSWKLPTGVTKSHGQGSLFHPFLLLREAHPKASSRPRSRSTLQSLDDHSAAFLAHPTLNRKWFWAFQAGYEWVSIHLHHCLYATMFEFHAAAIACGISDATAATSLVGLVVPFSFSFSLWKRTLLRKKSTGELPTPSPSLKGCCDLKYSIQASW